MRRLRRWVSWAALPSILFGAILLPTFAKDKDRPNLVHGLWVWDTFSVLQEPGSREKLLDFCQSQGINEVYISASHLGSDEGNRQATDLIASLHQYNIRVEALFGNAEADQPGVSRNRLLDHVVDVIQFNLRYPRSQFDGIHLDIEPQQRRENKGLKFMGHLVETYRKARELAEPAHMTVNADIAPRFFRAGRKERKKLFSAVPRLTLMLYDLSAPQDGKTAEQKAARLRRASQDALDRAYRDLHGDGLAKLGIALDAPDYGQLLPGMLQSLDSAYHNNPHYLGWARHSYNDYLRAAR